MSIIKGNTVGTPMPRSDWNETNPKKASYIKNKPTVLDGKDGGYYTPSVSNLDESTMTVSFTASKEGMPAISDMQVQLPRGLPGPPGIDGLPWTDLGMVDDVMAEMDNLLEDGRYRLWSDDPFCYSVEVERVGNCVGQTHWTSEEGRGSAYFRTAYYNGEEWEWVQEWTPHVTQDWLNQYALKTHKHRTSMNADFDSWIEVFREGQYQINVQAEAKSYIVDQFVFNNKPITTIHVCQRYFEVSEPWIVYTRHGTTNGNYVLVDWDEWSINDCEDGGYYTPEVTQSDDSTMTISFTPSKEGMPAVSDMQVQLPYGGAVISLKSSRVEDDAELATLLEGVYSAMSGATTKLVYWTGYPSATSHGWFGILSKSSQNNGSIKAWSANLTGSLVFKVKFSGAWKPLEWQNPPMDVDTEYRTTERYLGKPVYAKCISVGVLPSNAKSTTPHGISNSKNFVALWGHSGRYYFPTQWNADSIGTINIYATSTNVFVKTTAAWDNYAAYVTIKYTKTTD